VDAAFDAIKKARSGRKQITKREPPAEDTGR
jgi:hypothetical protein